jgi:hypothetical protein
MTIGTRSFSSLLPIFLPLGACGGVELADPVDNASQAVSVAGSFTVVPTPTLPTGTYRKSVLGGAAVAVGDVWAVGYQSVGTPRYKTLGLTEHWDGAAWSVVASSHITTPGYVREQLSAVAAADSSHVWAVGYAENPGCLCLQTLTEHWNGSAWQLVSSPSPGIASWLSGMALIDDADVWAVGSTLVDEPENDTYRAVPMMLHWDGTRWTAATFGQFRGTELVSAAAVAHNDVWAAGDLSTLNGAPAMLHYDGSGWSQVALPREPGDGNPSIEVTTIAGIAAVSTDDVWAVGSVFRPGTGYSYGASFPRTWHWNGSSWKIVTSPFAEDRNGFGGDGTLNAVRAFATDDVWAAGFAYTNTTTMHWDGNTWSNVSNPGDGEYANALAGSGSGHLWVLGDGEEDTVHTFAMEHRVP